MLVYYHYYCGKVVHIRGQYRSPIPNLLPLPAMELPNAKPYPSNIWRISSYCYCCYCYHYYRYRQVGPNSFQHLLVQHNSFFLYRKEQYQLFVVYPCCCCCWGCCYYCLDYLSLVGVPLTDHRKLSASLELDPNI